MPLGEEGFSAPSRLPIDGNTKDHFNMSQASVHRSPGKYITLPRDSSCVPFTRYLVSEGKVNVAACHGGGNCIRSGWENEGGRGRRTTNRRIKVTTKEIKKEYNEKFHEREFREYDEEE